MTHSFPPVCNFLFYKDIGQPIVRTSEGEIKFFLSFSIQKRKCGEQKKKGVTLTGVSKNGGDVRVGGGGWRCREGEGEHMWKTLQCGSRHSRSSWCVLLGGAAAAKG